MSRNSCQQRIKKIAIFRTNFKSRCTFATSDFPTENPRTQKTQLFLYKTVGNYNSEKLPTKILPNFTLKKSLKIGIKYYGIIYSSAEFTLAEFS